MSRQRVAVSRGPATRECFSQVVDEILGDLSVGLRKPDVVARQTGHRDSDAVGVPFGSCEPDGLRDGVDDVAPTSGAGGDLRECQEQVVALGGTGGRVERMTRQRGGVQARRLHVGPHSTGLPRSGHGGAPRRSRVRWSRCQPMLCELEGPFRSPQLYPRGGLQRLRNPGVDARHLPGGGSRNYGVAGQRMVEGDPPIGPDPYRAGALRRLQQLEHFGSRPSSDAGEEQRGVFTS